MMQNMNFKDVFEKNKFPFLGGAVGLLFLIVALVKRKKKNPITYRKRAILTARTGYTRAKNTMMSKTSRFRRK
jgi:hypothetical protein